MAKAKHVIDFEFLDGSRGDHCEVAFKLVESDCVCIDDLLHRYHVLSLFSSINSLEKSTSSASMGSG